jgi:hypothetical protein
MFNPNQLGCEALTRAQLRWTNTTEADDVTNFGRSFSPTTPLDDVTFREIAVPIDIASETGPWWPEIGSLVAFQR